MNLIPDTDIAIVKLNKDLQYINHTFGMVKNPGGNKIISLFIKKIYVRPIQVVD